MTLCLVDASDDSSRALAVLVPENEAWQAILELDVTDRGHRLQQILGFCEKLHQVSVHVWADFS